MRLLIASLAVVVVAAVSACGQGPRAVAGSAQKGTVRVLALDSAGHTFLTTPAADGSFHLLLPTAAPVKLFALQPSSVDVVRFAAAKNASTKTSILPASDGTVELGTLSTSAPGEEEPSENPLGEIDADHDGHDDLDEGHAEADNDDLDHDGTDDAGEADGHRGDSDTESGDSGGSGDSGDSAGDGSTDTSGHG